jgi:hypothetical protein
LEATVRGELGLLGGSFCAKTSLLSRVACMHACMYACVCVYVPQPRIPRAETPSSPSDGPSPLRRGRRPSAGTDAGGAAEGAAGAAAAPWASFPFPCPWLGGGLSGSDTCGDADGHQLLLGKKGGFHPIVSCWLLPCAPDLFLIDRCVSVCLLPPPIDHTHRSTLCVCRSTQEVDG